MTRHLERHQLSIGQKKDYSHCPFNAAPVKFGCHFIRITEQKFLLEFAPTFTSRAGRDKSYRGLRYFFLDKKLNTGTDLTIYIYSKTQGWMHHVYANLFMLKWYGNRTLDFGIENKPGMKKSFTGKYNMRFKKKLSIKNEFSMLYDHTLTTLLSYSILIFLLIFSSC